RKYLRMSISDSKIRPQKLHIKTDVRTLQDVQKLAGDIQWIRNTCGVTNQDLCLQPLFELLKNGQDPQDP
ncbi:POK18 protein, partial [Dasyornis broadbenti]|nr:POK18 protein [Dasyornis broadbenti]